MSFREESERFAWRLASYVKFARPRPAIMGWFSHHNLGDDAAEVCFNHYFDDQLAVITPQTYRRIPSNLKLLICGGGGWLNRDAPAHFLKYIKRINNRKFPCLFLSGGINRDYADHDYEKNYPLFKEFMSYFDYVATRDELSRQLLQRIGVADVKFMPEIVLGLPDDGKEINIDKKRGLKTVGLVLATHNKTVKDNYGQIYPFLLSSCEEIIRKGYRIICIPFQIDKRSSAHKAVDETIPASKLKKDLAENKDFIVLDKLMSVPQTLSFIKEEVSVVLSMRLHGNVMAAVAGTPFISLSYNDKHIGFLEMMKMLPYDVALKKGNFDSTGVISLLDLIEREYTQLTGHIKARVSELQDQTKEQIQIIRQRYNL